MIVNKLTKNYFVFSLFSETVGSLLKKDQVTRIIAALHSVLQFQFLCTSLSQLSFYFSIPSCFTKMKDRQFFLQKSDKTTNPTNLIIFILSKDKSELD